MLRTWHAVIPTRTVLVEASAEFWNSIYKSMYFVLEDFNGNDAFGDLRVFKFGSGKHGEDTKHLAMTWDSFILLTIRKHYRDRP